MAWKASCRFFPTTSWKRYRPKPWDLEVPIRKYFDPLPSRPTDPLYTRILVDVARQFRPMHLRPFHINDSIRHFPHPEKSPGLPYTSMGMKQKRDVDPLLLKQYVHNLKYGIYSRCNTPCTAATRSMVAATDKFRLIWCYPAHMTYAEGMFAQPLINAYKLNDKTPYALWVQYSKGHMRALMSHRTSREFKWFGLDWSAFDQRVPAWLIRDCFAILFGYFDLSKYWDRGVPTHAESLPRLWSCIVKYFINTPIKTPEGKVYRKAQGVPSGSYFTNLIDTLANAICTQYCLRSLGVSYSRTSQWYLGDDGLVLLLSELNIQDFASTAKEVFGFCLNEQKSEIGEYVSFLGYKMTPKGRPKASFDKLLAQLLLPDCPDSSEADFITRAVALQLSCFGVGCLEFTLLVDKYLATVNVEVLPLHHRSEVRQKLEQLGLGDFPPLKEVMLLVG